METSLLLSSFVHCSVKTNSLKEFSASLNMLDTEGTSEFILSEPLFFFSVTPI